MNIQSLVGMTLQSILMSPSIEIHPAWVDEDTPDITSFAVFLKFDKDQIYEITPYEVEISKNRYPALGLSIIKRTDHYTKIQLNGRNNEAEPIQESVFFLPQKIIEIQENDLLMDDYARYTLLLDKSISIVISHILPPITIGVTISSVKQDT